MGELIVYGLKIAFAIGIGITFMIAISTIISLLTTVVFGGVVSEVMSIISCCLPFDASAVFGSIQLALSAILAFMVAKKIWDLSGELFSLTA